MTLRNRTPRPTPVGPTRWALPDLRDAATPPITDEIPDHDDDLVAVGADLQPSTLIAAYRSGIFPWPHGSGPLPWFSPTSRGIVPPERLVVSKSLRQRLRRSGWTASVDADFDQVIENCSKRPGREGTWITSKMKAAYRDLHRLGHAHSVEVWDGATLVGGLYGVLVGGVFAGESMFHRETDASKVAFVELVHRHAEAGGSLVDVQLLTDHLASLGAIAIGRPLFLDLLVEVRDDDVRLVTDRLPVDRLAGINITLDPEQCPPTLLTS